MSPLSLLSPQLWITAVVIATAGYGAGRLHAWHNAELDEVEQRAEASESARDLERLANRNNSRINDAINKADLAAFAANALAAERLRKLAAARSEAAAACSQLDEPAAGILPDRTRRDLESLAQRANAVTRQLAGLQRYLVEVVAPACQIELPAESGPARSLPR